MDDPLALGGGRFSLTRVTGPPPGLCKRGPAPELAHEAAALRLLRGVDGIPALHRHAPGCLEMAFIPGAPRDLGTCGPDELRALGRLLAHVHARAGADGAALPWWDAPEHEPAAYAARRADGAGDALARAGHRIRIAPPAAMTAPFRVVHGDLVAANIVWAPGPHLVDWEFWRYGDPAEDLAYLAEANGLDDAALAHVADGHADRGAWARIAGWRPVVAAEIAAWWIEVGRDDLAAPPLARLGLSPASDPSGPPRRGDAGGPASGTPRSGARPGSSPPA